MRPAKAPEPSEAQVAAEMDRLAGRGLRELGYTEEDLERCAVLTSKINALKAVQQAVIPAHVYQRIEIVNGVADFTGDSYKLSKLCAETDARNIIFCGVAFMAETAKILNPGKEVWLPAIEAGCSLSESITADDVRKLKAAHPGAPVATYINTSASVKAESDVIVTSANAEKIVRRLYETHKKILFLPDAMMARNLAKALGKKLGRDMIAWEGTCVVHENFDAGQVALYRRRYPGLKILAHTECSPSLVSLVDFAGGTGDMMRYVKGTQAPSYMLVTECGLGDLARVEFPDKEFVPMCRLCPYMKATDLARVLAVLENPAPSQRVELPRELLDRARRPIERMFELAEA